MELYIKGFFNGSDILICPISKCSLILSHYPNVLNDVDIFIVFKEDDFLSLNKSIIEKYTDDMLISNYRIKIVKYSDINYDYAKVDLPVAVSRTSHLIYSGPASVYRCLVQSFYERTDKIPAFGIAQSCLKACKEKSKWTFYCEKGLIDFINDFNNCGFKEDLLSDINNSFVLHKGILNMDNYIMKKKDVHTFLEGPRMTLSDIVISFYLLEYSNINHTFKEVLLRFERLTNWLKLMKDALNSFIDDCKILRIKWNADDCRLNQNNSHQVSLIEGLEKLKISTKNNTVLTEIIYNINYEILKRPIENMTSLCFDWNTIHQELCPENSQIPKKRQQKKTDQLLNMINCTNKLVKSGMIIVDFCSGGGHLGLIMASIHPDCTIILLENKEESLFMAESRIIKSGLRNVKLYKCNIYAYKGHFDIGLALHACGTVTDLVIEICLSRNAHMVISPCCYGGIAPSPNVNYPRSLMFKEIKSDVYSKWCHAADCCNARLFRLEISKGAMHLIDSDRSFYVMERDYDAQIFKMIPQDCTPKNNILLFIKNK